MSDSKAYYRLFSVRYKKKSFTIRETNGVEYFDKIDIKIHAPKELSIMDSKTEIKQNGDVTTITVHFKGGKRDLQGENKNRLKVLSDKRKPKRLKKDLSNNSYIPTTFVVFQCEWTKYKDGTELEWFVPETAGKSILVGP